MLITWFITKRDCCTGRNAKKGNNLVFKAPLELTTRCLANDTVKILSQLLKNRCFLRQSFLFQLRTTWKLGLFFSQFSVCIHSPNSQSLTKEPT